jgi:hypothetical protein
MMSRSFRDAYRKSNSSWWPPPAVRTGLIIGRGGRAFGALALARDVRRRGDTLFSFILALLFQSKISQAVHISSKHLYLRSGLRCSGPGSALRLGGLAVLCHIVRVDGSRSLSFEDGSLLFVSVGLWFKDLAFARFGGFLR